MAAQGADFLARVRVPDAHRSVEAGHRQPRLGGAERTAENGVLMFPAVDHLPAAEVPQPHHAPDARGNEVLAVRADGDEEHAVSCRLQALDLPAGGRFPDLDTPSSPP